MSSFNGFKEVTEKLDAIDFNPYKKIGKEWFLVTAGDESGWNTMTASWGFAGVMWGKNTFTTVIRPQRYTKEFIDKAEYFTISFFKEEYKKALSFCGSHSGRDCDKAKETGLTPVELDGVATFAEAKLVLICKKQYTDMLKPEGFLIPETYQRWYNTDPLHKLFVGEILAAYERTDA